MAEASSYQSPLTSESELSAPLSGDSLSEDSFSEEKIDQQQRELSSSNTKQKRTKKPLDLIAMGQEVPTSKVASEEYAAIRKCLLMTLECRVLLREVAGYKIKMARIGTPNFVPGSLHNYQASGNLSVAEIQNLLMLHEENDDFETDLIGDIEELKRQMVQGLRLNHVAERDLKKLDKKIELLIQNRTNIQEIERENKRRKRKKAARAVATNNLFVQNKEKMRLYSQLFYLLQTEPKYLASLVYRVDPQHVDTFIDTLILTLYGEAYSPREEYLILKLFKIAIQKEVDGLKKHISALTQSETVTSKMVISYNRRKQGIEYLRSTLGPILQEVMNNTALSFEMKPYAIYRGLINEAEVATGQKSNLKRDVTPQEAAENSKVKKILQQREKSLRSLCNKFLKVIIRSLSNLPYGLRLILKQVKLFALEKFANRAMPDLLEEVYQVVGYFVYYRFINLAVVTPDNYKIGRDLSLNVRKNLVSISKVLQLVFSLQTFRDTSELAFMNKWIKDTRPIVERYFEDIVDVQNPEQVLQINKYNELAQRTDPLIIIEVKEMVEIHSLLTKYSRHIVDNDDKNDPLNVILGELGEVPSLDDIDDEKEVQLKLENRFKEAVTEKLQAGADLYARTKELVIRIFRKMPINPAQRQSLLSILKAGKKFARESNNKLLSKNIIKVLENIKKLEEDGRVTKNDKYTSFLRDVALEVANRANRREQQRREISRLQAALKAIKKYGEDMQEQINEFQSYLRSCRENVSTARTKKKKKLKTHKFTYQDLQKKGIIVFSEVPSISQKQTKFFISMGDEGVFDVEAKIAGLSAGKMMLELEELLEKKEKGDEHLELEKVTLDVNMTIYLMNKLFFLK